MAKFGSIVIEFDMDSAYEGMLEVISQLPLGDLVHLAERLAELTSFRRQFSADRPTVGGPIDCCEVSKDRGLQWLENKHRFRILGPHGCVAIGSEEWNMTSKTRRQETIKYYVRVPVPKGRELQGLHDTTETPPRSSVSSWKRN